ncbi:FHF complex subunit HOOK interacting protein 2A-like isoform X1 [Schistocerca americana]|uniref:FHF complex subunit HOOK interacting protein 2A-like isoform X1 n=2 Tax=Schistocerca americana TaxID=7009 RepID=UPI001F4F2712|nr:FHF complex subunit HOOK interacting protein 2A-like isoform X1 [Schistocerca americana]
MITKDSLTVSCSANDVMKESLERHGTSEVIHQQFSSSGTLLDDFLYHWRMILKFYERRDFHRNAVEITNVPAHLDQLLEILIQEEDAQAVGTTGPCLEYFLYHKLLDVLVALATSDSPPGMRHTVLVFVRRLVVKIRQPILSNAAIFPSVMQLIMTCNGKNGSPNESDEIAFLCMLCAVISEHPDLIHMFCNQMWLSNSLSNSEDTFVECEMELGNLISPGDDKCIHRKSEAEITKESSDPHILVSDSEQAHLDKVCDKKTTISLSPLSSEPPKGHQTKENHLYSTPNVLLECLLSFLSSEDNNVRTKACEGIMVIASISSDEHALHIIRQSSLPQTLCSKLRMLFDAIPQDIDPVELYNMKFNWGFDTPAWDEGAPFPGCREITSFFAWLDYCNQLVQEAHKIIGDSISKSIRRDFLEQCTSLHLVNIDDDQKLGIIALLRKGLRTVTAPALLQEFLVWFLGNTEENELPRSETPPVLNVIECCLHKADDISLEALQLFQSLLEKPSDCILKNLVLKYVNSRSYYNSSTSDSCAGSWSDEEDEWEKTRDIEVSSRVSSPVSRTLAPQNVHRIINKFLSLIPRNMQTSNTEESTYEQYVEDVRKQYQHCISCCSQYKWPLEAVFPESQESDDCCSSDSYPEADHRNNFYEGPFLRMLFTRLGQLPYQSYQVNLRLTGLISQLAMLPHPYLHEYLLNPTLPIIKGVVTLFKVLQQTAEELILKISEIEDHKAILSSTKLFLLQDKEYIVDENSTLFEGFIVLEEFCKELAAVVFVKYQNFS